MKIATNLIKIRLFFENITYRFYKIWNAFFLITMNVCFDVEII